MAENGKKELEELSSILPQFGVTSFLPTITPQKDDNKLLRALSNNQAHGSNILGLFLEGHYLNLTGAIPYINRNYSESFLNSLMESAGSYKLVFGVSPEIKEVLSLLPKMTSQGYPAFVTHTKATGAQTKRAISLGATHTTHFYNVFPYIGDKEPGVYGCGAIEAFLADKSTSVDFILDGEHVDPLALQVVKACKPVDKICLITDANSNAGLAPGRYTGLGGVNIVVK